MSGFPKLSRRARWAVPVAALVVTGGVMAGSLVSVAQAAPALPSRTPAQLLAEVAADSGPALSGTVLETASLGLPSLPGNASPTSISSLLTGSHTFRVWYAAPEHYRLAAPSSLSETDVIRNGQTVWIWQSTANSVTEITVPAHAAKPMPAATPALTPQQGQQRHGGRAGRLRARARAQGLQVAGRPGAAGDRRA
jgi:hypothetical protein